MEVITRAAIMHRGKPYDVPQPGRHHHVVRLLAEMFPDEMPVNGTQGFLTNTGRFVDRVEGLRIAQAAGQIIKKHGNDRQLFSEDMW